MTREEASKILRIHQECLKAQENGKCKHHLIARCEPCEYYTSDEDFNEAESMAIKYLQKEPCEDAISRNLVLSTVKSGLIRNIDGEKWKRVMDNVKEVQNLPPVQPEPKTGKWNKIIDKSSIWREAWHYECSNCGNYISGYGKYKYCPECGTKMEEGEQGEIE